MLLLPVREKESIRTLRERRRRRSYVETNKARHSPTITIMAPLLAAPEAHRKDPLPVVIPVLPQTFLPFTAITSSHSLFTPLPIYEVG